MILSKLLLLTGVLLASVLNLVWRSTVAAEADMLISPSRTSRDNHSATCRILVMQQMLDVHLEVLESVALRYPLPWEDLGCSKAGIDEKDPILVDFLLPFQWYPPAKHSKLESWGWREYFEERLRGVTKRRVKAEGRFVQFGNVVNGTDSIIDASYAAQIDATCDIQPKRSWAWMRQDERRNYCILHGKSNPTMIVPPDLANRICYLNPMHSPNCWFLPTDFPEYPPPLPPSSTNNMTVCIPRKNATFVARALNQLHTTKVVVMMMGRTVKSRDMDLFKAHNVSGYVKVRKGMYLVFQQRISQCHVIIPLLDPVSTPKYFLGDDASVNVGRLSGYVAQSIAYRMPTILHKDVVDIYRDVLSAPYFSYETTTQDDGSSFVAAFQEMLEYFKSRNGFSPR